MNRSLFFQRLRSRATDIFGTSLSHRQVDGIEAILDECRDRGASMHQTAYILATAYGESGGRMRSVRENMNYRASRIPKVFKNRKRWQGLSPSQLAHKPKLLANTVYGGAWGKKHLGNIKPNDGWNFRGGLVSQITGRTNYTKWGERLGIDFIGDPSQIENATPRTDALCTVRPMLEGWATGRKLSEFINADRKDYFGARAVWNHGSSAPADYARYAEQFEGALKAGGWKQSAPKPDKKPSGLIALISAALAMFKSIKKGNQS